MIDLTQTLIKKYTPGERKIGRYNVSDLYGITHGYIRPADYQKSKRITALDAFRMWQGRWKHEQVQELLKEKGYACEQKVEYPFYRNDPLKPEWVLVGKADAILEDHGLEIKTTDVVLDKAKDSHRYQSQIYSSLFKLPWQVVQPITKGDRIILKNLGFIKQDDEWFMTQLTLLDIFHQQLIKYVLEKNRTI